jgi:GNAT superfamily N-acetyltransferase
VPASRSVSFRDMTPADVADGLRLSRASGWNQTEADWRLLLALGPGLFRVGEESGRVVASGGAVRYGRALGWVCMILVDPAVRGRGIGTAVFDEVLDRCRDERRAGRLDAVGLDATPAGRGIYVQRGFVDGPPLARMRVVPADVRPATATRTRLLSAVDLDEVLALDRAVFAADRGSVLRWAWEGAPELAHVVRDDGGGLAGYALGRHGDHSDHVGPVVAEDLEVALDLVRAALAATRGRPLIVDAVVDTAWSDGLSALGFREQRPFTRMSLGPRKAHTPPLRERAVFGPEFG